MQLRPHQLEAVEALSNNNKGQIIVPTGGGKTMCMITDALNQFEDGNKTLVVVAPRILLAEQLSTEFMEAIREKYCSVQMMHVHSGKFKNIFSTTSPVKIAEWCKLFKGNKIIFTTYHSLNRIKESYARVDTIYYDEAHNSVQKNFVEAVDYFSIYAVSYTHLTLQTILLV